MEFTGHLPLRLRQLLSGLSLQKIAKRLDLHQVELAILESPAGKLARLGKPDRPMQSADGVDHRINDSKSAMKTKFEDILSSRTARRFKEGCHTAVEDGTCGRVPDTDKRCEARRQWPR
jgi:hypothetical protein